MKRLHTKPLLEIVMLLVVAETIPTLAMASTYVPLGTGTSCVYEGIPFQVWGAGVDTKHTVDPYEFIPLGSLDLSAYGTAKTLHVLQCCAWADNVPDGVPAGHLTVFYQDGSKSSLDLIVGVNTAEWSYDCPCLEGCLQHTKVPPAFSYDTGEGYDGHHFYVSIPLEEKPLDRLELALDPASYTDQGYHGCALAENFGVGITAVTIEYPPTAEPCVAFEDHFDDFLIGPGWNTYFSTTGSAYEKTSEIGSILVMFADGTDIWTDNDEYGAVYMSVEGDFDAILKVQFQNFIHPWSKAGIAIRNDMSQPGSPEGPGSLGYAGIFVTPGNGYAFHWDAGRPGGCGTSVSALRANSNYPDHPDGSESITSFAGPIDWADCYGQRIWGLIQPPAAADLIVAEELLVDLRAEDLSFGSAVTTWPNRGTLGAFTAFGTPVVETVGGMKCVTFDGSNWFTGPASIPGIEGAGTRSMEVWAYNPSMPGEETLLSWAHRGGPEGSNMAFNYGNDSRWGAVGHWGGDTHDIGWWGSHSPAPAANTWWHLAYTYDGTAARVYVDGAEESVRDPIALNTHGGTPVRVAAQADETGEGVDGTFNFTGSIAEVRIHDGVLTQEEILNNSKLGYFFRIASDDNSELWLSTDDNPANAQLIAEVPGWTPPDEYGWYPSQRSGPIVLDPSKKYYIEALHKEGWGGDHLTVQWSGPGFDWQTIEGQFLREWWTTGWGPDGFLDSNVNEGGATYPCWVKLEKRGTNFTGYYSTSGPDGSWTYVGGATLDNAETVQDVGMIATSHVKGKLGGVAFDYFALLDAGAPDFELQVTPTVLWPPNHKMVEITPSWIVYDAFDPSPVVSLESITMNEGDQTSTYDPGYDGTIGDGHTIADIYVDGEGRIFLRAERSGTGSGRIYTITYQAADFCGNVTEQSATVTVPHDQR